MWEYRNSGATARIWGWGCPQSLEFSPIGWEHKTLPWKGAVESAKLLPAAHSRCKIKEGLQTRLCISWGVVERSGTWVPRAYLHTRTQGDTLIRCEEPGKDRFQTENGGGWVQTSRLFWG